MQRLQLLQIIPSSLLQFRNTSETLNQFMNLTELLGWVINWTQGLHGTTEKRIPRVEYRIRTVQDRTPEARDRD